MKLSLEALKDREAWQGYHLPDYDPAELVRSTQKKPQWLHFGPGNIFRIFPAVLCQRLIEQGRMDTGILCCEGYDGEVITRGFQPYDNLTVAVTLNADGSMEKEIVASMTHALILERDWETVAEIFRQPSLQMVSFTITEKGYGLRDANGNLHPAVAEDMARGPEHCKSFLAQVASLCLERKRACGRPLALVSMDNCSRNGEKLRSAVLEIARAWLKGGKIGTDDYAYLEGNVAFPWSMIDKITPRPHPAVEEQLTKDGLEDISPFVTAKHTYTAPFVNAEKPQYLVLEDDFPNGRPPLEEVGVIFAPRDIVSKVEKMKVCTCLNPLHTCLAIYGCLLGYTTIADTMRDEELSRLVEQMSRWEGMPFVVDPQVIDPGRFLNEVLTIRLPNPFIPDTPQRIATDTSQKLAIRFGETIKAYVESRDREARRLKLIPLVLAGWLRYLMGVDDTGRTFELSPDPLLPEMQKKLSGLTLGGSVDDERIHLILGDASIWGVDLNECGLGERITAYLRELTAGPGAVRATLKRHVRPSYVLEAIDNV